MNKEIKIFFLDKKHTKRTEIPVKGFKYKTLSIRETYNRTIVYMEATSNIVVKLVKK